MHLADVGDVPHRPLPALRRLAARRAGGLDDPLAVGGEAGEELQVAVAEEPGRVDDRGGGEQQLVGDRPALILEAQAHRPVLGQAVWRSARGRASSRRSGAAGAPAGADGGRRG